MVLIVRNTIIIDKISQLYRNYNLVGQRNERIIGVLEVKVDKLENNISYQFNFFLL